jgi:LPPG:FO 2-phospho-L-lactate transferase
MITVLCGGVGGSRFLRALAAAVEAERITAIVNTGDDDWFHGLYVSPDPDIVTYALAGEVDEAQGWGLRGDTFRWLRSIERFGHETWFRIGDRDLATHLHRTRLIHEGVPLSSIIADIARAFGVRMQLLPMSDDSIRTVVTTDAGDLSFQEFLVKRHASDPVRAVRFDGGTTSRPAPGVLEAVERADAVFIAPSNPIGSIGPILAVPGVRDALERTRTRRVAISPIIGGRSLQPPAGEMMSGLGYRVDALGVAELYAGIIDTLIIDTADAALEDEISKTGVEVIVTQTVMGDAAARESLARAALGAAGVRP